MAEIDVVYIEDDDIEAELFSLGLSTRGVNVLHIPDAEPRSLHLLQKAPLCYRPCHFYRFLDRCRQRAGCRKVTP